jgi:hypothetical protein
MQKEEEAGCEQAARGYITPRGGVGRWTGWASWALGRCKQCCSRGQRQGSAGVWRWQRRAVRQIKAKSPVQPVSENGSTVRNAMRAQAVERQR